jgi:hypothetical protein
MKRIDYFLDFQKLEELTNSSYWFDERDKAHFKYEFLKQTYLNKTAKKYKYPVMLYLGNKKFSIKYDLEDILELIKNGATKAETDYYRKHFNAYEINSQKQQFLNSLKSFTPCGIFYNRKSRVEIKQLNGILMLQNLYDNLNTEQLQQIIDDKLTYAVFNLLDSDRYAVLVRTNGMNSRNYMQFQKYSKSYYYHLLHEKILKTAQINEVTRITHDENLYYNPNSDIVSAKIIN